MTRLSMIQNFFDSSAQTPTKRRRPASHHRPMSLESLEVKRLLTTVAPDVIIADDASALTSSATSPGFRAVMPQQDGTVVAAGTFQGSQGDDFTLVRYTTDGQLDGSFGSNGIVQSNFSSGWRKSARHDTLWGAGVDSQGRVVASGQDRYGNLVVARYSANGSLDTSFSSNGYDKPGSSARLDASMQTIAFDAANNVYIAGEWQDQLFRVVKYKASGTLDAGFGVNGVFTLQVEDRVAGSGDGPNNRTVNIAIYESAPGVEKILLSGTVNVDSVPTRMAAVLRLNLDGSLDSSFDDDGIVTTNVPYNGDPGHNNYGNGIAADNQGRILIAGMSSHGMNVIRYNSDGSLDTSFNASGLGSDMPGVAVINSPSEAPLQRITRGRDLVLDEVGRIVVGGTYKQNPSSGVEGVSDGDAFVVARLDPDGTLDSGFGTGGSGIFELLVGSGANELTDIMITPNGDIWAAGQACSAGESCNAYGGGEPFDAVLLRFAAPVASNVPPTADAGGTYAGSEDVPISFDATASMDLDGDSLNYTWDFGDGNVVTTPDPTPTHTYQWGGNFAVMLTVDDGRGGTDTATTTASVTEANDVPVADAGGPYSGEPSMAITLDASASSDFDNLDGSLGNDQSLTYIWDFGDGSPMLSTTTATVDHTYAADGTYQVTLTVDDGVTQSTGAQTTATVAAAPVSQDVLLLSLRSSQTVDGISVANEDILAFNGSGFEKRFDGSDVGLGSLRIDAFAFLSDMEIVMSFDQPGSVPGLGTVDDSDLVMFTASRLGESTAGSFSLYFDGSDVGLTSNGEDIDGLEILPDGTLLISTNGSPKVPGVNGRDEDILAFSPSQIGANTSGVWSMYFDGSDVGLSSSSSEDVNAIALAASGALRLSTTGNFGVSGQSGEDDDVFTFNPTSTGPNTSGSFDPDLFFAGNQWGLSSNDIYGLEIDWV